MIRKTARLASYYNSQWFLLYVQVPRESADRIALNKQRHLINNFRLATELGAEIVKIQSKNIAMTIMEQCEERKITTVCIGKPHLDIWRIILATDTFNSLLKRLSKQNVDLVILS